MLSLEAIDQIDDVEEAAACATADERAGAVCDFPVPVPASRTAPIQSFAFTWGSQARAGANIASAPTFRVGLVIGAGART
jgi:hypothetical protein